MSWPGFPDATLLIHDRVSASNADPSWQALPKIDSPALLMVIAKPVDTGADLSVALETRSLGGDPSVVADTSLVLADGQIAAMIHIPDDKLGQEVRMTWAVGDAAEYDLHAVLVTEAKYAETAGSIAGFELIETSASGAGPWQPEDLLALSSSGSETAKALAIDDPPGDNATHGLATVSSGQFSQEADVGVLVEGSKARIIVPWLLNGEAYFFVELQRDDGAGGAFTTIAGQTWKLGNQWDDGLIISDYLDASVISGRKVRAKYTQTDGDPVTLTLGCYVECIVD